MATSRHTSTELRSKDQRSRQGSTLARPLAPEEVRRGQFVTLLEEFAELPSFFWCADPALLPHDQTVRIRLIPASGGVPLRVCRVCLPFVLVKQPCGKQRTLDVRKCRLARLAKGYARVAWKAFKK